MKKGNIVEVELDKEMAEKEIQVRHGEYAGRKLSKHYTVNINKNGDLILCCGKIIHGYIKVVNCPSEKSLFRD